MKITWDTEANKLLNNESVDYTLSPYRLKPSFKLHCIVVEDHANGDIHAFYNGTKYELDGRRYAEVDDEYTYILENYEAIEYNHYQLGEFPKWIEEHNIELAVAHNGINYDHLVVKMYYGMDYSVYPDSWCGRDVVIEDTMVRSKVQNPDRFGGHSLDKLSEKVGLRKIDFRPYVKQEDRFNTFAADMLYYCIRDVKVNTLVYKWLLSEAGDWNWKDAYELEKAVAEIITRQEHRGFKFDKELAEKNIAELDQMMLERKQRVDPVLPKKPATKGFMKDYTPPKQQFNKDGKPSSNMQKFAAKLGAEIVGEVFDYKFKWNGRVYDTPLPLEPLLTEQDASIDDTTHIKQWLVREFGWRPSEYKEKDISEKKNGKISVKRTEQEYEEAIDKYVQETANSAFRDDRLDLLGCTLSKLKPQLMKRFGGGRVKVPTNPNFTKGQDKQVCPDLERIAEEFPFAKDCIEYLTFKHRRNSILGGGLDWDEEEEAEKGYIANMRDDGRISTPADSCGTSTRRFKHRVVANIPRPSSLYGEQMRSLFGVDDEFIQLGYDFDSLEAKIESHYVYKYPGGKEYGVSLTAEKPNDCHSVLARKISEILQRDFARSTAKNVKYGCLPVDNSEVLTQYGWKRYSDLCVGDLVVSYNTLLGVSELTPIEKLWYYKDAEVITMKNKWFCVESTADHRWFGDSIRQIGSKKHTVKVKDQVFFTTSEMKSTQSILNSAKYIGGESKVTPSESALIAWLLSDGYYKWSELSETTSSSHGMRKGIIGSIAQSSHKYWMEIESILADVGMPYTKDTKLENGKDFYTYRLSSSHLRDFLDKVVGSREQKHAVDWCSWLLSLSSAAIEAWLHNFWLADGHNNKSTKIITQNSGNIADAVILAANLCGYRTTYHNKSGKCLTINLSDKNTTTGQRIKKSVSRKTDVFCITTKNGTFITRQGKTITITGNCSYNAQPPRVARTVGCDLATGEIIFNAFWEQAYPLKALKENMVKYWETKGDKKFLLGLDGCKLPIRSKGNCINTAFQSAGVICAKRAMVIHDRKLKAEGLIVDFFIDDWRSKTFCQQLIGYHDEGQLEVSKSLVQFKMFQDKEQAIAWKKEFESSKSKILSDVGHVGDKYYVGYCRAGELAVESVKEAGEYYNLNIELTAGYMLGNSWASCH